MSLLSINGMHGHEKPQRFYFNKESKVLSTTRTGFSAFSQAWSLHKNQFQKNPMFNRKSPGAAEEVLIPKTPFPANSDNRKI